MAETGPTPLPLLLASSAQGRIRCARSEAMSIRSLAWEMAGARDSSTLPTNWSQPLATMWKMATLSRVMIAAMHFDDGAVSSDDDDSDDDNGDNDGDDRVEDIEELTS